MLPESTMPDTEQLPRLLATLNICGVMIPVWLSSAQLEPHLEHADAYYYNGKIFLDQDASESRRPGLIMHELLHAIISQSGCRNTCTSIGKLSIAQFDALEEAIVWSVANILADSLKRNHEELATLGILRKGPTLARN